MNIKHIKYLHLTLSIMLIVLLGFSQVGYAQNTSNATTSGKNEKESIIYQDINMETTAPLYWALGMLNVNDNEHVDNYLKLTKCDLYNDYFQNEFQWGNVRKQAKMYLQDRMDTKDFNLRYEFMQPLKLGDYDVENETFYLQDEYQINGLRRFEIVAAGAQEKICGNGRDFKGYSRGLVAEFSRPVGLIKFPVKKEIARDYISEKQERFRKLRSVYQTRERLYDMRDAYMVMKIKFFAANGYERVESGMSYMRVLATLEGLDIYADKELTLPMYTKNFSQNRELSPLEKQLREEYKARLKAKIKSDMEKINQQLGTE